MFLQQKARMEKRACGRRSGMAIAGHRDFEDCSRESEFYSKFN